MIGKCIPCCWKYISNEFSLCDNMHKHITDVVFERNGRSYHWKPTKEHLTYARQVFETFPWWMLFRFDFTIHFTNIAWPVSSALFIMKYHSYSIIGAALCVKSDKNYVLRTAVDDALREVWVEIYHGQTNINCLYMVYVLLWSHSIYSLYYIRFFPAWFNEE